VRRVGDITRRQLQDKPNVDSLYLPMLNTTSARSRATPKIRRAKEVLTALIKNLAGRAGGEFRPRRARPDGISLGEDQQHQPENDRGIVKGFGPGPYEDCKVYENVAQ